MLTYWTDNWLPKYPYGYVDKDGYLRVPTYMGYQFAHRLIMEDTLGRPLKPYEVVHHLDENKLNNCLENLEVMNKLEHDRLHKNNRLKEVK